MYSNNHYNKNLKHYARELRSETVLRAEKYLWKSWLRKKQSGYRFLRQRPIDRFIVDFFCPDVKLIVEIDGNSHYSRPEYDRYRQNRLESLGYSFIRFSEGEVLNQLEAVVDRINHALYSLKEMALNGVTPPRSPLEGGKSDALS